MITLPKGMNEHYGRNVDRMPQLLRAGEVPMSTAQLMKARLQQGEEFPDLWNSWVDTSDLIVYPKGNDKEVYFLLATNNQGEVTPNGRKALELITPENLASNRGAVVESITSLGQRGRIKVSRDKLTTGEYLNQEQALAETTWRILARDPNMVGSEFAEDESLLKEYEAQVRAKTEQGTNMAVYLGDSLPDENTLKAWFVSRLGGRSDASGRYDLDSNGGRFVGIAPEALGEPTEDKRVRAYNPDQIGGALEELGFSGLTKTLIDKLKKEK